MLSRLSKKPQITSGEDGPQVKTAVRRLEKDLNDLSGTSAKLSIPDKSNLQQLELLVSPIDGIYRGGAFHFKIFVPDEYPHKPPKVTYLGPRRLWHPNIEGDADKTEWGVCLNILRADWKPVMTLKDVLFGMELLFFEPNPDDPLPGTAKEAAQMLRDDRRKFEAKARAWMDGRYN